LETPSGWFVAICLGLTKAPSFFTDILFPATTFVHFLRSMIQGNLPGIGFKKPDSDKKKMMILQFIGEK
jgi:hypothetical protein